MEKEIEGFEGYSVDKFGNVFSNEKNIIKKYKKGKTIIVTTKRKRLKPSDNGTGYKMVSLTKNGTRKQRYVHRLVAKAFIDNPLGLDEVNHIDGDKSNNSVTNLEWVTRSDNMLHCTRVLGRKNRSGKNVICVETGKIYSSLKEASEKTGANYVSISHCICGINKTAGGKHWKLNQG